MKHNCGMPKACISCDFYNHTGYAFDKYSPFKDWSGKASNNGRVQYGTCVQHNSEVFSTEICSIYRSMPGVQVLEVKNRVAAKEARQERLF